MKAFRAGPGIPMTIVSICLIISHSSIDDTQILRLDRKHFPIIAISVSRLIQRMVMVKDERTMAANLTVIVGGWTWRDR